MTRLDQTRAERIAATLARSDLISSDKHGLVPTDGLWAVYYSRKPVTLPETPYDREVCHD